MTTATAEIVPTKQTELPDAVVRRGITEAQWRALFNLFPGGKADSVLMVWDYCTTRRLDPLKKPCHIVPMDYKDANGQWQKRDVVMPGIYEYRITAQRTGLYLGHTEPDYGPDAELAGVTAPTWCAMTFYRWNDKARERVPFPVKVWFAEVVATNREGAANTRWSKAPIQMLTKCTEAAGLREAFPEEFGGEATAEEMDGRQIESETIPAAVSSPQPAQRKSQQPVPVAATVQPPAPEAVAVATPAPSAPACIGKIALIADRQHGTLIKLDTGFVCASKSPELIAAAKARQADQSVVELATRPSSDPTKFAPTLEEIRIQTEAAQ
jgi:phage recombination protein Bet